MFIWRGCGAKPLALLMAAYARRDSAQTNERAIPPALSEAKPLERVKTKPDETSDD